MGTTAIEYTPCVSEEKTTVYVRFIIKMHTILSIYIKIYMVGDKFKVFFDVFKEWTPNQPNHSRDILAWKLWKLLFSLCFDFPVCFVVLRSLMESVTTNDKKIFSSSEIKVNNLLLASIARWSIWSQFTQINCLFYPYKIGIRSLFWMLWFDAFGSRLNHYPTCSLGYDQLSDGSKPTTWTDVNISKSRQWTGLKEWNQLYVARG